jgi:hypothetical protein
VRHPGEQVCQCGEKAVSSRVPDPLEAEDRTGLLEYLWRDANFPVRIVRHKTIVGTVEGVPDT